MRLVLIAYAIYKYNKLIRSSKEGVLTNELIEGAVLLKLLMNYLSMMMIIRFSLEDLKPDWHKKIDQKSLELSSNSDHPSEDCILKLIFPFQSNLLRKIWRDTLFPFFGIFITSLAFSIYYLVKGQSIWKRLITERKIYMISIAFFFASLTEIMVNTFQMFGKIKFRESDAEQEEYAVNAYDIVHFSEGHKQIMWVSWVGYVVIVGVLPMVLWYKVWKI